MNRISKDNVITPTTENTPKVYLILRPLGNTLNNAWVRLSQDINSAHAFAQALLVNNIPYLYTKLSIFGVNQFPVPQILYLAIGEQDNKLHLKSLRIGLFKTFDDAKQGGLIMQRADPSIKRVQVITCHVQNGLTCDDEKILDHLEMNIKKEIEQLKLTKKKSSS